MASSFDLNRRIRRFYDRSTPLWEATWGEHMHHGHYGPDGDVAKDHHRAQIDMIEMLLDWGDVHRARRVLDVGCGVGGSALYLARKLEAEVTGITLSPVQAYRARERAVTAGLAGRTRFEVADAMMPPFPPGSFDLVWSLESGEHMPDKAAFLQACADLLRPGGLFLMAVWCHRPVPPPLSAGEHRFLRRLYRAYHLPPMVSIDRYAACAVEAGLVQVETADWTRAVAPFWKAVVRSALHPKSLKGLVQAGWPTIRGALAMNRMIRGYRRGLVRFGVLRGIKVA